MAKIHAVVDTETKQSKLYVDDMEHDVEHCNVGCMTYADEMGNDQKIAYCSYSKKMSDGSTMHVAYNSETGKSNKSIYKEIAAAIKRVIASEKLSRILGSKTPVKTFKTNEISQITIETRPDENKDGPKFIKEREEPAH